MRQCPGLQVKRALGHRELEAMKREKLAMLSKSLQNKTLKQVLTITIMYNFAVNRSHNILRAFGFVPLI